MKKIGHYIIRGEIELLSGTRIGGSDDVLQIGGTDLTCIKDPVTRKPYIPGSSIKGKMRSSLEKAWGKFGGDGSDPCGCARADCPVCRVFGPHKKTDHNLGPTRIIVRDAPVVGDFTLENKTESVNDRKSSAAKHPRTVERVAPGARFSLEIGVQEFDLDSSFTYKDSENNDRRAADALIEVVDHALNAMEQVGIGAGTSKGYGKIRIHWDGTVEKCQRRSHTRTPQDSECVG
ncbi:MAG: type III-A CRISPR-associated RAMP protein Csm3 [Phycisphaerae bacterium]|nr:type III-A CRISPR-associated RAMP protein Csm3 [Phycisphaerae bacterium]HON91156.1 type III-A CRISPR-associated RAMP protein Csm3 [Sedimentisphaerales bacterium]